MISIVCPVYNEENYIRNILDFCIAAGPADKEIIFIDGNSTDATCDIIKQYAALNTNIQLLHNPGRYVPYALNQAIPKCKGNIIIRLDAHTEYEPDYFEKIVETFNHTDAHIVGGPMRIAPGTPVQNAIGYASSTMFGIGNSSFHFEDYEGYTNSVYLGAWKKEMFNKTGLFDEAFVRNQDDEFHYRAKSLGFKIYQSPVIKVYYHPRQNFKSLFSQYYQYGNYKPMVLSKIRSAVKVSHLVPALFVLYLLLLVPALYFLGVWALFPLGIYAISNLSFAVASRQSFKQILLISLVYFTMHMAYGSGFLLGLFKPLTYKNAVAAIA